MRVIAGSARGRRLQAPQGRNTRPTTDRVKESIFNIIQFDIPGRRVLDLFAGSGQMGIECLSRGAESCIFVESDRRAQHFHTYSPIWNNKTHEDSGLQPLTSLYLFHCHPLVIQPCLLLHYNYRS